MAVWRRRAYETFGFTAGDYSYSRGKIELFADLVVMAQRAGNEGDVDLLDRIAEYACWAAAQTADDLQSAVDLAFFLPVVRDAELTRILRGRIPAQLFDEKLHLLGEHSNVSDT